MSTLFSFFISSPDSPHAIAKAYGLTLEFLHDKRESGDYPDKAKPFVRRGQKAAGLNSKMAELPKDDIPLEARFFCERAYSKQKPKRGREDYDKPSRTKYIWRPGAS